MILMENNDQFESTSSGNIRKYLLSAWWCGRFTDIKNKRVDLMKKWANFLPQNQYKTYQWKKWPLLFCIVPFSWQMMAFPHCILINVMQNKILPVYIITVNITMMSSYKINIILELQKMLLRMGKQNPKEYKIRFYFLDLG